MMVQLLHQVPGRVRFRIKPPLSGAPASNQAGAVHRPAQSLAQSLAQSTTRGRWDGAVGSLQALADRLRREPGVQTVRANAACGSLVLHYDPARTDPERLRAAVSSALLSPVAGRRWPPLLAGGLPPSPANGRAPTAITDRRAPQQCTGARCRLCRLQVRLARWLLRSTLQCWWLDWRGAELRRARTRPTPWAAASGWGAGAGRLRAVRPGSQPSDWSSEPLLARLRRRFGGESGHPVAVVSA